jgi:hypothetical protein
MVKTRTTHYDVAEHLENLKWDIKVRKQAAKIAEYMALARDHCADSSVEDYRKANRLSWELALWLSFGASPSSVAV